MFPIASTVYGLVALLNLKNRATLTVALSFFLIEYAQYVLDFDWTAAHYFAGAAFTLLPVRLAYLLSPSKSRRITVSCLGLVCIYFVAWVCSEAGLPESPFKWPHIAILLYQGVVLHGTDSMDGRCNLLANPGEFWTRFRLRYDSGN